MRSTRQAAWIFLPFLVAACSGNDDLDVPDHHAHDGEENVGSTESALKANDPVSVAVSQSCTTLTVRPLATQLVKEIECLKPGSMTRIDNVAGLALGNAAFPFLQTPAANALSAAQKARGVTMSINSGLRTLPDQYLLYRWYQTKRCGISLAAKPGTSNHESGIAVDINDNAGWRSAMASKNFRWLGASDPVHFDYIGGGTVKLSGLSILAFQRLWNRNHPTDKIAEDSSYGPMTEARLMKSPIGGFPIGAKCDPVTDAGTDAGDAGLTDDDTDEPPAIPDATEPDEDASNVEERGPGEDRSAAAVDLSDEDESGCAVSSAPLGHGTAGAALAAFLGTALALGRRRSRRPNTER